MSAIAVSLTEWQTLTPNLGTPLAGADLGDDQARRLAEKLTLAGALEVRELRQGLLVRATSFVGRVVLGNLTVTVRPKLAPDTLLNLLRYGFRLRHLQRFSGATFSPEQHAFQELLLIQLQEEAAELLARGLDRRYVRTEETLASPRGRIDVGALARRNAAAVAALPCVHFLRLEDALVNQVLLAGLRLGSAVTGDLALRSALRRLAALLSEEVGAIELNHSVFQRLRATTDRLTRAYEPALTIIELLAFPLGTALGEDDKQVHLPGFLFDMNRFFQALLSRFLGENLPGYRLIDEYRLSDLMRYREGMNPRSWQSPRPRPDFVVYEDASPVALLDAKYIDLWERGPGRDILYQLAVYALSQEAGGSATILYPTTNPDATTAELELVDPITGRPRETIVMRPVHLRRLDELVRLPRSAANDRAQADYARELVFGKRRQW